VREELENVEKGIIDCRTANIPPYDLEDWKLHGRSESEVELADGRQPPGRPARRKRAS
jgi:hypothetical protein